MQYVFLFVLGLLLAAFGVYQLRLVTKSKGWPTAAGQILASRVEARHSPAATSEDADSNSYFPVVQYHFQAGPYVYQGHRIGFSEQGYATPARAAKALAPYPAGQSVWVFFNPANPNDSVLERKNNSGYIPLGVGLLFMVLVIVDRIVH